MIRLSERVSAACLSYLALLGAGFCLRMLGLQRTLRLFARANLGGGGLMGAASARLSHPGSRWPLMRPSCLSRAAAARLLTGEGVSVRIGVRRKGDGIEAHAWIGDREGDEEEFREIALF